jgi:ribosomal 50S subunit-associated protein YjgA (DUF615 family)
MGSHASDTVDELVAMVIKGNPEKFAQEIRDRYDTPEKIKSHIAKCRALHLIGYLLKRKD